MYLIKRNEDAGLVKILFLFLFCVLHTHTPIDLIYSVEDANNLTIGTAGIFSTYPNKNISHGTAFGDQVYQNLPKFSKYTKTAFFPNESLFCLISNNN